MEKSNFEWDEQKDKLNQLKHCISFEKAQYVFKDTKRIIAKDMEHSSLEDRYYCFGKVEGEIITVRFTYRKEK